jgi:hypothetical protein
MRQRAARRFLRAINHLDYDGLNAMKIPGFMLLLAGWGITLAAIVLLPKPVPRCVFMLAGVAVELLGLGLLIRSQYLARQVGL